MRTVTTKRATTRPQTQSRATPPSRSKASIARTQNSPRNVVDGESSRLEAPLLADVELDNVTAQLEPLYQGPSDSEREAQSMAMFSFNEFKSRTLDSHRLLLNVAPLSCAQQTYDLSTLPTVSIIISFYNEAWSTLIRTLWSIIDRTPPELLEEVILVDDGSTHEWLQLSLIHI